MPEGQFTGSRGSYLYTMDDETVIALTLDDTIGSIENNGLTAATQQAPGSPKPLNFTPRGVYWVGELNGNQKKKFIPCDLDGDLYTTNSAVALTIDGVVGRTTGRVGEKLTFPRIPLTNQAE